jgi:hypothetical protein
VASLLPCARKDPTIEVTKLDELEICKIYFRLLPMAWRRKMDENVQFDRTRDGLRGRIEYAPVGQMDYRCAEGRRQSRIVEKTKDVEREDLWRFVLNYDLISLSIDNQLY